MLQLKFAFRSLLKTPIVTSTAVLSVALGIGANVAIFSMFNHLLLKPLPVQRPDELVNLLSAGPRSGTVSCGQAGTCDEIFSYQMFRDLERVQTVFTGIAAHRDFGANIAFGSASEGGDGMFVSGSYFSVLGLTPHLGRLLNPDDDREPGSGRVVVLSYDYWRRRFGERSDVIDQTLRVNGQPMTIVGVAPRGFHGTTVGNRPLMYVPISMREAIVPRWKGFENRRSYWAYLFARLKPGVTVEWAHAAFNPQFRAILTEVDLPLQQGMRQADLAQFREMQMQLVPGSRGQSRLPQESRRPLTLLFCVTAVVLLICCANVANLLLGRAARRSTEMAVRLSIGAGRKHLIGQLLVESVLLGVMGGLGGLLVARWTLAAMAGIMPGDAAESLAPQLDARMLMFAAALSLLTGLLFGLFPALHSTSPNLVGALKANAGQPSGARAAARFRVTVATAQIALSMALLVSAGLFTKSLSNISRVDLGLDIEKLVMFGVAPGMNGHTVTRTGQMLGSIEDELSRFPGVSAVTTSRVRLISGDASMSGFSIQGIAKDPDDTSSAFYNYVGADFLRTLGIRLLSGREFSRADLDTTPKVAIVNQAFVQKFNLGSNPVGKRMHRAARGDGFDIEIVGVAADSAYDEVKGARIPVVLMPNRQDPDLAYATFYVRTRGDEQDLLAAIPRAVRGIDPTLPVANLRTMAAQINANVSLDRFVTLMSAAFAALATLLAALGLYGVLAYTVTQRTREFGLRMALGAGAADVRRLVLRQVGIMTAVGACIGLVAAFAMGRAAESLLFQMNAREPVVFAGAAILLSVVALCAGFIPAHRASRIDPMTALRYE